MGNLSTDGLTILNNYDRYTGVPFNATKVTTWYDGSAMNDNKVDNAIYFKNPASLGGGYSKRNIDGEVIQAKWFGVVPSLDGLTNIVDNTAAITKAFTYASLYNCILEFDFGFYACNEVCIVKPRIKAIRTHNSNLGEATNSKKATIIPWLNNQRYIWKFGGLADLSAVPDLETYSCKGLELNMNFSSMAGTASSKTITDSAVILECFTSGDLALGFYDLNGRALRMKNCWETRIRSLALRRISNFGGEQWLCDDANFSLGANTSELVVDNITSGEGNCTILRTTSLSFFTKINVGSVVFEHNSSKFNGGNVALPTKAQLDLATNIPLFNFGYANGVMMQNINLCGLNKNMPINSGTNYKYVPFNISGICTLTANLNVNDCNSTTYLTDGVGHQDAVLHINLTQGQYNRTSAGGITDPISIVNLMVDGTVKVDSTVTQKDLQYRHYSGGELLTILDQNYTAPGTPNFKIQRASGLEYAIKVLKTGQTFLRSNTVKGLRAKVYINTSASALIARRINGASQSDISYPITPSTWTIVDVDLYDVATSSLQFRLLTTLSTDDVSIQWIAFYCTDSGSVTKLAFTNGNGFTGTVSNATTTPSLSLVLQDASASQSGQVNTTTQTFNGNKTVNGVITANGNTSSQMIINGLVGNVRDLVFQTGGIASWNQRIDVTAQTGSNAGSDWNLIGRADDGSSLGTYLFVKRSNGNLTIGSATDLGYKLSPASPGTNGYFKAANFIVDASGTVTSPTPTPGDNSTKVATTAFVQNATASDITSISIASANGLNGSVSGTVKAPILTIGTSVTGIAKGNGAAFIAAIANTDYLPVANAALTGVPTTPTAAPGTNTVQIASTAFVQNAISGGSGITSISVASANGLNGSVTGTSTPVITIGTSVTGIAKGNGSAFIPAVANTDYLPVSSPAMSGTPTAPTAAPGTNNTQVASTAFVQAALPTPISLTTTGTSGAATLSGGVLNIPNYTTGGGGGSGVQRLDSFYTTLPAPSTQAPVYTFTVPANTLTADGQFIEFRIDGSITGGSSSGISIFFGTGSGLFGTGPVAYSTGGYLSIIGRIYRTSSTTSRYTIEADMGYAGSPNTHQLAFGDQSSRNWAIGNNLRVETYDTVAGNSRLVAGSVVFYS